MNSEPIAGTYRGITKPKFTHSLVSIGTSMLDLTHYCAKKQFRNESKTHCLYRQGYNQAKLHLVS
jgi:hypothetical protein